MTTKGPRWIRAVLFLVAGLWVLPVVGILVSSLRPNDELAAGWWSLSKVSVTLEAWITIWDKYSLLPAAWVSLRLAGFAALGTMLLTPAAAYALHWLKFPFRRTVLIIIVNAFVLPPQIAIIPLFRLWRDWGMLDHMSAVLIPNIGLSFAWSIYLVKNFLEDFPEELIEAARIDGCGPCATFFHIVLPGLMMPVLSIGIIQFIWCWNSLLFPLLYLRTQTALPVVFSQIAGPYDAHWNQQAAAAVATMIMPLLLFMAFQSLFVGASVIPGHSAGRRPGGAKAPIRLWRSGGRSSLFSRRPLPWQRSRR